MFDRCLYFNLNALSRQVNRIWDQAFAELGLSPSHAYLLRVVLANPGITQKAIAEEMKLEKSTITRFINALEEKRLVVRKRLARGDGREYHIKPTKKAERLHEDLEKTASSLARRMSKKLGAKNVKQLVEQLKQIESELAQG